MRIHPAIPYVIAAVIVVVAGGYLMWASMTAHWPYTFYATPTPSATASPAPTAVQYRSSQYGLAVALPASWQGFTTFNDTYTIFNIATGAQEGTGVVVKIRHPQWTAANPREDLPVMIFTPANWERVLAEQISVGAAPIPPSLLARNSQYVFALPARYNFDFRTGWEEVQAIIDAHSITAFEPLTDTANWKTYTNDQYGFEVKYPARVLAQQTNKANPSFDLSFSLPIPNSNERWPIVDILILTKNQYTQLRAEDVPQPPVIASSNTYVAVLYHTQECPETNLCNNNTQLITQIPATFKFTK